MARRARSRLATILLVSGSEARALPGIEPDHKTILTNRSILELPEIPKTLIVMGAGAVGVEFASIYNSFGTQVTILEALPRVVPVEDEEISAELEKDFKKKGINIQTGMQVDAVKKDAKGVTVSFKDKDGKAQTLQAEKLLLAVGRKADDGELRAGKIEGQAGARIRADVNEFMETDEPGLYAIGDIVAGLPQLAHAAMMEGIVAVTHIAGKPTHPIVKTRIPNATYCEPQIGSIGLTEKQAREAGYKVKIGKFPFVGNSKATILGNHGGFIKVVSDEKLRRSAGNSHYRAVGDGNFVGGGGGVASRGHHRRHDEHDSRASRRYGKGWGMRLRRCVACRSTCERLQFAVVRSRVKWHGGGLVRSFAFTLNLKLSTLDISLPHL